MGWTSAWGFNSHTQRSPPHTRSHARHRETDARRGCQRDNFRVGLGVSSTAEPKGKTLTEALIWKRSGVCAFGRQLSRKKPLLESAPRRKRNRELKPAARTKRKRRTGLTSPRSKRNELLYFEGQLRSWSHWLCVVTERRTVAERGSASRQTRVKVWRAELRH